MGDKMKEEREERLSVLVLEGRARPQPVVVSAAGSTAGRVGSGAHLARRCPRGIGHHAEKQSDALSKWRRCEDWRDSLLDVKRTTFSLASGLQPELLFDILLSYFCSVEHVS